MMKPQFDLEGKYALITGASGGIGTAAARLFAQAGATLFVAGTREEKLKSLCAELEGLGAGCSFMALDINGRNAPSRLVEAAVKEMGRLDILVNALGINRPQPPEEITEENWDAVFNTNLRSVFFLCQSAGRQMIKQQYGRIVNISSQAGSVALPLRAAYCASKAGVDMMTRVLAVEWASHNIRVNAVAPTFVETPFRGPLALLGDAAHATSPQLGQGANSALLDALALGDALAKTDDVARALALYARLRRRHVRFYQFASAVMTPFFQSDSRLLANVRDLAFHRMKSLPYLRREMLRTLAGLKTGLLAADTARGLAGMPPASPDAAVDALFPTG